MFDSAGALVWSPWLVVACLGIGLAAGTLGGLAGVGGSILMIPALGMVLGYPESSSQHGYMAAAMACNVFAAAPAALRHRRAGAVRFDLLPVLLPVTAGTLIAGVLLGNTLRGWHLQVLLAAFLTLQAGALVRAVMTRRPERSAESERTTGSRLSISGGATGLVSGVLGLGGGVILVPLLQALCGIRLRHAIGTSSAVMCVTTVIGAGVKLGTLGGEGQSPVRALMLAGCMAPGALLGGRVGAMLTHRLPLGWVRGVIAAVFIVAAWRLTTAAGRLAGWW